jgi:hypothetical protein
VHKFEPNKLIKNIGPTNLHTKKWPTKREKKERRFRVSEKLIQKYEPIELMQKFEPSKHVNKYLILYTNMIRIINKYLSNGYYLLSKQNNNLPIRASWGESTAHILFVE